MKSGEKKKLAFAFGFLVLAFTYLYFSLFGNSSAPKPVAEDATSRRQSALNSLTKNEATPFTPGPARKGRTIVDALAVDPVLRLDLLAKMQNVKYEGSDRNIFQFYTAPPPPMPTVVKSPIVATNNQAPPPGPPPAAPTPSIPLKYYGIVTTLRTQARKACLQDGDDIFVAAEGETVNKKYRVLKITEQGSEHTVEVEDTTSHVKAKIPLQEDKAS